MKKQNISFNKKEYNKVMEVAQKINKVINAEMSVDEFIALYEEMVIIIADPLEIDKLVWGNRFAYKNFEFQDYEKPSEELCKLYKTCEQAWCTIDYWVGKWETTYNTLKYTTTQDVWNEEFFKKFTTLD